MGPEAFLLNKMYSKRVIKDGGDAFSQALSSYSQYFSSREQPTSSQWQGWQMIYLRSVFQNVCLGSTDIMLPWGDKGDGCGEIIETGKGLSLAGLWTVWETGTHWAESSLLFSVASLGGSRHLSLTQFWGQHATDTLLDAGALQGISPLTERLHERKSLWDCQGEIYI